MQICPLYISGNNPPQMVPMDLNIGETRVWRLDSWAKSTTLVNNLHTYNMRGDFFHPFAIRTNHGHRYVEPLGLPHVAEGYGVASRPWKSMVGREVGSKDAKIKEMYLNPPFGCQISAPVWGCFGCFLGD